MEFFIFEIYLNKEILYHQFIIKLICVELNATAILLCILKYIKNDSLVKTGVIKVLSDLKDIFIKGIIQAFVFLLNIVVDLIFY